MYNKHIHCKSIVISPILGANSMGKTQENWNEESELLLTVSSTTQLVVSILLLINRISFRFISSVLSQLCELVFLGTIDIKTKKSLCFYYDTL